MKPAQIKKIRKERGFSQERFAQKLGIARQTVIKWEYGICSPIPSLRRAIEKIANRPLPKKKKPAGKLKSSALALLLLVLTPTAYAVETATVSEPLLNQAVITQNYGVGFVGVFDGDKTTFGPYGELTMKQKLFKDFTGDLLLRIAKQAGTDDEATLLLERATLAYSRNWVNLSLGRQELSFLLSPGSYFGSYVVMGEGSQDSVTASLRLRLSGDIPDSDASFSNQEIAFRVHYIPSPFNTAHTTSDGTQSFIITQLFLGLDTWGVLSSVYANYGQFMDAYFSGSSFSSRPSVEFGYSQLWSRQYKVFVTYANQDTGRDDASVFATGLEAYNLKKQLKIIDRLQFEYQIPLNPSDRNPFTGGNPLDPDDTETPQNALFIRAHNSLGDNTPAEADRFFYGAALTNSIGDYTLARLRPGTTAATVPPAFGNGVKVQRVRFRSIDRDYAFLFYVGYEF